MEQQQFTFACEGCGGRTKRKGFQLLRAECVTCESELHTGPLQGVLPDGRRRTGRKTAVANQTEGDLKKRATQVQSAHQQSDRGFFDIERTQGSLPRSVHNMRRE